MCMVLCNWAGVLYKAAFRPFCCYIMLRNTNSDNAQPLNTPNVAHNFTKALDEAPNYRENFVQFRCC